MKRIGHLFEQAFTPEALYQAWEDASRGKRGKRATLEFSRSLYTFTQSAKNGALDSVISILGHAKNTASLRHLLTTLKEKHHDLFSRLPLRCHTRYHAHAAPA